MARTTIRTEDVTDSEVTTAKMAVDPTNASNLSSGSVPLAQLGNVDTTAIVANQDDIALLGFKIAANGSLAKYNLVDQTVDDFQDASGVDASGSTNETRNSANYYSGYSAPTGGTITTYSSGGSDYTVHSFLSNGSFVLGGSGTADVLLIAGGGGGGSGQGSSNGGGGGGAGGYLESTSDSLNSGTYTITVGAGGSGGAAVSGSDGSDSTIVETTWGTSTAVGGGGGGKQNVNGSSGGSGGGGGGGGSSASGGSGTQANSNGLTGYGNGGGTGRYNNPYKGGGGGGAGGSGVNGDSSGTGGSGKSNSIRTGSGVTYAAGGNGDDINGGNASNAAANTGNGGGAAGGAGSATSGDGGSGIAVIRYIDGQFIGYNDLTLVSNSTTAQATPTKGDIVMTYTNGAGTATVNTDIKAYASRDNGTTYTQMTLASQGTTGGHTILTAHDVDISGQPSGTSMRYKITTHNQSSSKETRIQAVSLGWS